MREDQGLKHHCTMNVHCLVDSPDEVPIVERRGFGVELFLPGLVPEYPL